MSNVIPKPSFLKTGAENKTGFSKNTAAEGGFLKTKAFFERIICKDLPEYAPNKLYFTLSESLSHEEYSIKSKNGDIYIYASGEAGAFYAVMTLLQLSGGHGHLTLAEVTDKPAFGYRGIMLDCGRHFWSIPKIKQILDIMALVKLNKFHWHLTDDQGWRAEIKKYPLLTQKGAVRSSTPLSMLKGASLKDGTPYGEGLFYTQEEMREVVAYAKERHIEVIPEVDMPGHLSAAIACYPGLSCTGDAIEVWDKFGVIKNIGCCGKDAFYDFAYDVIDELCEIFSGEYFHIGGDEVPKDSWQKCPDCQGKIKRLGLSGEEMLQHLFNCDMAKYLAKKGKKTIVWNDALSGTARPEKNVAVQWWKGKKKYRSAIKKHIENGGEVIMSPVMNVYMDHPYAVRPLSLTYSLTQKSMGIEGAAGVEAPLWTEYIRTEDRLDFNLFARLICLSEVGWSLPQNKNYADFEARLEENRSFFLKYGAKLPPKRIYRGGAGKSLVVSFLKWMKNPAYEYELAQKHAEDDRI